MLTLQSKVSTVPTICNVYIATKTTTLPSFNSVYPQDFIDTRFLDQNFSSVYFRKSKVSFKETSKDTVSGKYYNQLLTFSFPNGDALRASRIRDLEKAKYFLLALSTNKYIVLGRNDVSQNSSPKIQSILTEKLASIKVSIKSIVPAGHTFLFSGSSFPYITPSTP